MKILVTAGPTREFFDSVRFISNPSSGRMGYAIAREAAKRGHDVTLVSGPVHLKPPANVTFVPVVTAAEMAAAAKKAFRDADAAIMTAAVCDYRPVARAKLKLAKKDQPKRVELEPTEDIAASLGRRKAQRKGQRKGPRLLIGFAMEDHDARAHAERKLANKNCDLIVLNGPENVGSSDATVELYSHATGWSDPVHGSKPAVARQLIRAIEELAARR